MRCDKPNCKLPHPPWPTEGVLVIERCDYKCEFCMAKFKGWFLRRHVREVHCKHEYPDLIVSDGWTGKPKGNAKPHSEEAKNNRRYVKQAKRAKASRATTVQPAPMQTTQLEPTIPSTPPLQIQPNYDVLPDFDLNNNDDSSYVAGAASSEFLYPGFDNNECIAADSLLDLYCDLSQSAIGDSTTIDPSIFRRPSVYISTSPWSTPQSVRTDGSHIDAESPITLFDGGNDILQRALNDALIAVRMSGTIMTDQQMLGGAQKFLKAFAEGRDFP